MIFNPSYHIISYMNDGRPDLSQKARKRISKKLKGHSVSKKTREKISKKLLKYHTNRTTPLIPWCKGKKLSKITREKMSNVRKGRKHWWGNKIGESLKKTWANNPKLKKRHSKLIKKAMKKKYPNGRNGKVAPNWMEGLTEKNYSIRHQKGYKVWRRKVLEKYPICNICKKRKSTQSDHIKPISAFPELALVLSNGQGLCEICHRIKTKEDYKKYIYK